MITASRTTITVKTEINESVEKVWNYWNDPRHIVNWAHASDDWHAPRAENDIRTGGKFHIRMEARDGSDGFDFSGVYDRVILLKQIKYTMNDGRSVRTRFDSEDNWTNITMVIETESHNPVELQQKGWQAILNNFRKYLEKSGRLEKLHFEITINVNAEKVYSTMIDKEKYGEWTAVFNPASHYKGTWEKGSKIYFIGDSPEGGQGGMLSLIRENIPFRYICIEHLGVIENGQEVESGQNGIWTGAEESYTFNDRNGATLLQVDIDVTEQFRSYFLEHWPMALQKLKEICESSN